MAREKQNENENAVVPTGPRGGELQLSARRYWTSLDLSTDRGQILYMKCKGAETVPGTTMIGKTLEVTDILVHEVEDIDDETGEVYFWVRYCLVLKDDTIVSGGSQGIRNSLADIIELKGSPPWKGGIKVKLVSQKTSKKFSVHLLQLV
jgi:Phage Single-stranded DNA-binding protein